ncbi:MAG: pyridoxamine 5'-phosphate oxidase family protein [Actinobacteria bacterium]|nr:pyridoxamine 5'-phosphate oxidase family protein [Actinomycetota bacterium]
MPSDECLARLARARHGVLATVHERRGVDAVPVVFALSDRRLILPVDTVKPKATTALQRLANIDADPSACLLVDGWDEDWSRLWWVRASGRARRLDGDELAPAIAALATRYGPYRRPGAVVAALELSIDELRGWSAS